jgi:transcriptional regulator with XRE-family HTH domain
MAKRKYVKLSDRVRQIILDSGVTRYRISKDTGIDAATLCRFMAGTAGLSLTALDTLAEYFDLEIVVGKRGGK